jgi:hypothetical protein
MGPDHIKAGITATPGWIKKILDLQCLKFLKDLNNANGEIYKTSHEQVDLDLRASKVCKTGS